jgi:hypothetical protein
MGIKKILGITPKVFCNNGISKLAVPTKDTIAGDLLNINQ